MNLSKAVLLGTVLLPVLCGAEPPKYQEPADEPIAKLLVVLPRPKLYFVHLTAVDPARCKSVATIGWLSGGRKVDENRIGMLGSSPPGDGTLERRVRAGTSLAVAPTFVVAQLNATDWLLFPLTAGQQRIRNKQAGTCRVPIFVPEAGAQYELTIEPSPGECAVKLERLSADANGALVREEVTVPADQLISAPTLRCSK
jgi:hypothetical protein